MKRSMKYLLMNTVSSVSPSYSSIPLSRTTKFLAAAAIVLLAGIAHGQSGTWTNLATGNWSDVTNWNGTIADASGNTADFSTINLTSDITVHLDTARTIGNLTFGDTDTGSAAGWLLDLDNRGALA